VNTSEAIKQLREQTGAGMLECKNVLTQANGDLEKALAILKEKGVETAKKRVYRLTTSGIIGQYVHANQQLAVLVEIHCETEVAASTLIFKDFVHDIAVHIAAAKPDNISDLMEQQYYRDESKNVQDVFWEFIAILRENVIVKRFVCFEVGKYYD